MANVRYREEVFNVILAQLLHERGVVSAPEQVLRLTGTRRRRMPDILVTFQGLRTAIEGKVADQPNAESEARQNAIDRVDQGISHIAIAVIYPAELRAIAFGKLKASLAGCNLRIAVYSETGESGWVDGDLDHLADLLRRTYEQLVEEDVVAQAVAVLSEAVEGFAQALLSESANVERAASALGISGAPENQSPEEPTDDD